MGGLLKQHRRAGEKLQSIYHDVDKVDMQVGLLADYEGRLQPYSGT